MALTVALILPTAIALGAAFPLALGVAGARRAEVTSRFGVIYAINTVGAVFGSLAAGFYVIPYLGLQTALKIVSLCLVAAALAVIASAARELAQRRLEAEQSKFEVGMSTNYFVVQAQRDLRDAQNIELRTLLDYRKSLVDFERVQETSLARAGITIIGGTSTTNQAARVNTGGGGGGGNVGGGQ